MQRELQINTMVYLHFTNIVHLFFQNIHLFVPSLTSKFVSNIYLNGSKIP